MKKYNIKKEDEIKNITSCVVENADNKKHFKVFMKILRIIHFIVIPLTYLIHILLYYCNNKYASLFTLNTIILIDLVVFINIIIDISRRLFKRLHSKKNNH